MRKLVIGLTAAMLWVDAATPTAQISPIVGTSTKATAADFAEPPSLSDPLLSPDGNKVAVTMRGPDDAQLVGIFAVGKWDAPLRTLSAAENASVRSYRWAGSDRLVISLMTIRQMFGLIIPFTRVLSYTPSTGRVLRLGDSQGLIGDDVIYLDPLGRYLLLAVQKSLVSSPRVDRIDLATGVAVEVQPPRSGVTDWYADPSGTVRAGVDYGERKSKIHYRAGPDGVWQTMRVSNEIDDDSVFDSMRFAAEPGQGIVITNGRTGRFGVYRYDFTSQTLGAALFEHPTHDVDGVVMATDGVGLDGVTYEDDRPRTHWLSPEFAQLQQRIDRALPDRTNSIINRSQDGGRILFRSESASDPGAYYLFDRKTRRIERFAVPYAQVDATNLSEVRPVRFTARDGLALSAFLTVPKGSAGKRLPMVMLPHGGPFERDRWSYDPLVQFLASLGYAVLQPQFRGTTGRGRALVEAGYGQWGLKMQDDIDDAADWAAKQGLADPARVCIAGASYGGYAAMWGAIRNPERYRCAISLAGVSDIRDMLKYDSRFLIAKRYVPKWKIKVIGEDKRDLAAVSPLQQAKRLRIPLLIAHGELDQNVPPEQSRRMVKALQSGGIPVESVFYPKSAHGVTDAKELADFLQRLASFLGKHNPA